MAAAKKYRPRRRARRPAQVWASFIADLLSGLVVATTATASKSKGKFVILFQGSQLPAQILQAPEKERILGNHPR